MSKLHLLSISQLILVDLSKHLLPNDKLLELYNVFEDKIDQIKDARKN